MLQNNNTWKKLIAYNCQKNDVPTFPCAKRKWPSYGRFIDRQESKDELDYSYFGFCYFIWYLVNLVNMAGLVFQIVATDWRQPPAAAPTRLLNSKFYLFEYANILKSKTFTQLVWLYLSICVSFSFRQVKFLIVWSNIGGTWKR